MITVRIPGGSYVDARLDGAYAGIRGDVIQTHSGDIPTEGGTLPLFLRCNDGGPFVFAGQGSNFPGTVIWNRGWSRDPRIPTPHGVIYSGGDLFIWQGGPDQSSQGYRYVRPDGSLVMSDDTMLREGVSEWTDLSDAQDGSILIGQGHQGGGVVVRIDGVLRMLHAGACHAVRARQRDGNVVVAFYVTGDAGYVHWLSVDAMRALPAVAVAAPVPIPPVVIPPEPEHLSMKLDPRVRALLIAFAAKFPVPRTIGGGEAHEERARQWSIKFCEQVNFSLLGEGYGTKRADGGRPISKDTISQQRDGEMVTWDLLVGTGTGEPSLNLDPHGEVTTGQVFVPVDAVNHLGASVPEPAPTPTPTPTPPPAGCNCAADVAHVRADITALTDMLLMLPANLAGLVEQIMDEKLSELPAPEPSTAFPAYEGRIFGQKVRLEPKP
jgi:hypothetical protein